MAFGLLYLPIRAALADGMCDTARTAVAERLVCDSPALAWDDRRLNALYSLATRLEPSGIRVLKVSEMAWLSGTRDKCVTAVCLEKAYAQRNKKLAAVVNGLADPMPKVSMWDRDWTRCNGCSGAFGVNFVRQPNGSAIGVWEGSANGTFVTGGLLDGSFDGNILAVRVLGGRGPSWHAGVALLARRGTHLFIANMYERSSIGMFHDVEFFDDTALRKSDDRNVSLGLDYGNPTPGDLANAWADTIKEARARKECVSRADLDVCMRRKRP